MFLLLLLLCITTSGAAADFLPHDYFDPSWDNVLNKLTFPDRDSVGKRAEYLNAVIRSAPFVLKTEKEKPVFAFTGAIQASGGGRSQQDRTGADDFISSPPAEIPQRSTWNRLKRAELLALGVQFTFMGVFQAMDVWDSSHRPFANARNNLHRAWTTAPVWDKDSFIFNYIGHPYTGAMTYNFMRSQKASLLASWLFSSSQSLIWEYTMEAMEEQPSIQDLLFTSNLGSLFGEGFHRLTLKMKNNGFSFKEKIAVLIIDPGYVLNNGFQ